VAAVSVVVGLDLSLTASGVATPEGVWTITSKGAKDASLVARAIRLQRILQQIFVEVSRAANEARGDVLVVLEAPAFSRTTGHQHDRSGLWWLVVHEIGSWDRIDLVEVQPTARAKYATGKGNAGKDEVLAAVVRRYPDVEVRNNNEADALVLRAMGCDHLGSPLADVPQTHRAALEKIRWPS
jgi:crossover junction endodeoxyribonuclease RuvC